MQTRLFLCVSSQLKMFNGEECLKIVGNDDLNAVLEILANQKIAESVCVIFESWMRHISPSIIIYPVSTEETVDSMDSVPIYRRPDIQELVETSELISSVYTLITINIFIFILPNKKKHKKSHCTFWLLSLLQHRIFYKKKSWLASARNSLQSIQSTYVRIFCLCLERQ